MTSAQSGDSQRSVELPSIKNSLLKPRTLLYTLIFSLSLNFALLCGLAFTVGNNPTNSQNNQIQPTMHTTPRDTVPPSKTPTEEINALNKCFNDCDKDDLIKTVRIVALDIDYFKAQFVSHSITSKTCYATYLEFAPQDREFATHFSYLCENGYVSRPPQDTIQIGDNIYYLNSTGNWSLQSEPRISKTKLIRVVDDLINEQNKTVEMDDSQQYKTITGTSRVVNSLNQEVTQTTSVTIDENLNVLRYEREIGGVSKELGNFFGLRVENIIEVPIN